MKPSGADAPVELTPVERTALQVCMARVHMGERLQALTSGIGMSYDPAADAALAAAATQALPEDPAPFPQQSNERIAAMMLVRTVEIDRQALAALNGKAEGQHAAVRQVVIIGAGLDPRAWRLEWPAGTAVYEVDTGSVEDLKVRVLGAIGMKAASRCFVKLELSRSEEVLAEALKSAGFDPSRPCLWIVEGFIGYIAFEQGRELMKAMLDASAPGSHLIMTAPPTMKVKQEMDAVGYSLRHQYLADPEEVANSLEEAGWQNVVVHAAADLGRKYGVENHAQAILEASKQH